jgi:magnesium chelatase family protein
VGVIGGGQRPMPGAVFLAHHGLLWLDERPEVTRPILEVLRQLLADAAQRRTSR